MNFKELSLENKQQYANLMFQRLSSAEELKNWVMLFLGLDMPIGQVDPDSNSSPIDAMWEIYDNIRSNRGDEIPGYIMLSAREAYKTLGASILETILVLHFEITIAHMSAIQAQSAKAIQYINYFFNKIEPLLEVSNWVKTSENKSKISFRTNNGEDAYIKVIVATMAGANCVSGNSIIDTTSGPITAKDAYDKLLSGKSISFISYNHDTKDVEPKKVTASFIENKKLVKIELENGTTIECSPEHKFYVEGKGYVEAKDLKETDFLSVK